MDQLPTGLTENKNKTKQQPGNPPEGSLALRIIFQPGSLDFPGRGKKNAPGYLSALFSGGNAAATSEQPTYREQCVPLSVQTGDPCVLRFAGVLEPFKRQPRLIPFGLFKNEGFFFLNHFFHFRAGSSWTKE